MAEFKSFDGKVFSDIVDKAKYEEEMTSTYDYYVILNSEKRMNDGETLSYVISCPGIICVKKELGIDGIKEMRIFLRQSYGDEFIDAEAGIKKWLFTKMNVLSVDGCEFMSRYPIIFKVDNIVNIKKR